MHNDPEIEEIRREQQRQRNRRIVRTFALVAALVVGIVVLAYVSEPYLRTQRNEAREASAVGSLRAIASAQAVFNMTCGGFYAATLSQLGRPDSSGVAPLSADLTTADAVEKSGYRIWIDAQPSADAPACNGLTAGQLARSYVVRAEPLASEGEKFFAMSSESAEIYESGETIRFSNGVATGAATVR